LAAPGLVDHAAGQQSVADLQHIGAGVINPEAVADAVGEEGKAAGDQQHLQSGSLAGLHQFARTRVELQPLVVDALHVGQTHATQQRHALAQALLVVGNLSAHGRLGNGRHLGLASNCIGDFVHAFDVDQGRIHVERNQSEISQGAQGLRPADHQCVV